MRMERMTPACAAARAGDGRRGSAVAAAARRLAGIAGLAGVLVGCAQVPPQETVAAGPVVTVDAQRASPVPPAVERYLLHADDELDIRYPNRPEYNQVVKVRPDGRISLPYLQAVEAAGRTPEEVAADIARRYRELTIPDTPGVRAEYLIAPRDALEIKFPYQPNFTQLVSVRPDGYISLSLVREVAAAGRTPSELEADLVQRYRAFLKQPELVVVVRSFSGTRVKVGDRIVRAGLEDLQPVVMLRSYVPPQIFIGGEVLRPGVMPYTRSLTALQAIMAAGGQRPTGEMRNVTILRKTVAEPLLITRDLLADMKEGRTNDIYLQPSDVVIVPKTGIAEVAAFLDQYLYQILPPLRNSSFAFIYDIRRNSNTTTTVRTVQ